MDFERCWRDYNRRKKLEAKTSTASEELRGESKGRLRAAARKSKDKQEPIDSWNEFAGRNTTTELIDPWNELDDNIDPIAKSAKESPSSKNRRSRSPFTEVTG